MPRSDKIKRLDKSKAGHTSWLFTENRTARTAPGRQAFEDSFVAKARELFPDLTDAEIAVRAGHLRKIHYIEMAKRSAEVRRKRPGA